MQCRGVLSFCSNHGIALTFVAKSEQKTALYLHQTPSNINGVCIAHDGFDSSTSLDGHYSSSGVILFAGEQSRVMAFYVPALGPAPRLNKIIRILESPPFPFFYCYNVVVIMMVVV